MAVNFYDIVYSLAGQKNVDKLNDELKTIDRELLTETEINVLDFMLKGYADEGMYPSYTFLTNKFEVTAQRTAKNKTDVKSGLKDFLQTRREETIKADISEKLSEENFDDMLSGLSTILEGSRSASPKGIERFSNPKNLYDAYKSMDGGIRTGMPAIDELTGGFQPGTTYTIAAFTSHGKSMVMNNSAYINAKKGKKGLIISMEVAKELVYQVLLSRHSYSGKMPIAYEQVFRRELSKKEYEHYFGQNVESYKKEINDNLLVVGTEDLHGYSTEQILRLYKEAEEILGHLDFVVWDHVNMFEYIDLGFGITANHVIKRLVDIGKSWKNANGHRITTGLAAQTNREGYKYAKRHEGEYEMTAISDFHEIERGSTYVMFCYAEKEMMVEGAMKVQLKKNRIGSLMVAPEAIKTEPRYSVTGEKWKQMIVNLGDEKMDEAFDGMTDAHDLGVLDAIDIDNPLDDSNF